MSKEYLSQEKLNDALTQMRLLWQSPCSTAEFNDGVRALVDAGQEAVETIKRLRKIAAYVPARAYIEAKEKAGFAEQIVTAASAQETSSARPEHVAAHDCACAECVAAEPVMAKVRQHFDERRCGCKDYPGADEFCTAHKVGPGESNAK